MQEWQKEKFLQHVQYNQVPSGTHLKRTLSSFGWLLSLLSTPWSSFNIVPYHLTSMSNYWSNRSIKGLCVVMWLSWKFKKKCTQLCRNGENVWGLVLFSTAFFFFFSFWKFKKRFLFFYPLSQDVRFWWQIPVANALSNNWVATVYLSLPDPRDLWLPPPLPKQTLGIFVNATTAEIEEC